MILFLCYLIVFQTLLAVFLGVALYRLSKRYDKAVAHGGLLLTQAQVLYQELAMARKGMGVSVKEPTVQ